MRSPLTEWLAGGSFFEHRGHRIFVRRAGDGPALLLVHGYPISSYDWHRVWGPFSARYAVIAPDMLGMGFSDKPAAHRYSVMDHAEMHEALLRELGITRLHVLAHDLGVSVVQEMLARRLKAPALPEIASVVFLNGGLFAETYRPRFIQRVLCSPLGRFVGPLVPKTAFDSALRELFGPDTQPSETELALMWDLVDHNQGRRVTHRVGRFVLDRAAFRDRLVEPLARRVTPMRLINGLLDPNSGAHMVERYRDVVANADVVELPRIGHWPQLEAPAEVLAAAHAFFRANP